MLDYGALINRSIHISLSEIMSSFDSAGKGRVSFHFVAIQIKEKTISKWITLICHPQGKQHEKGFGAG